MVAVPELCSAGPVVGTGAGQPASPSLCRRMVAVAATARELLRPESDLVRVISGIPQVDLLLAGDDGVRSEPFDDLDDTADDPAYESDVNDADERAVQLAALALPGLRVHRLGLPEPLGPAAEADLVAALSELVGFDPEPGVYCLAPAPAPADVGRSVLVAATRRIAQVYGLPMLRYRCLEFAVVPEPRDGLRG